MKIIHVNHQDSGFGAYISARRLNNELRRQGHDSRLWVLSKTTDDPAVAALFGPNPVGQIIWRLGGLWNNRALRGYPKKPLYGWSASTLSLGVLRRVNRAKPDLVVLHQIDGVLAYSEVQHIEAPVLWMFHDMYPFTGDCHHSFGCEGFKNECGCCPQLGSNDGNDISRTGWRKKTAAWRHPRMIGIAPSRWIRDCAASSPICRGKDIRHIPTGIPLDVFNPSLREKARAELGFSDNSIHLLTGASALGNNLKGFDLAVGAAKILRLRHKHIKLVTFGASPPELPGVDTLHMGFIRDENKMAALFAACDLYVYPTMADNFPTVLVESIACGTPCATVPVGGCVDIVRDGVTGFVAGDRSPESVAAACGRALGLPRRDSLALRASCRAVAEAEYGIERMAERYLAVAPL